MKKFTVKPAHLAAGLQKVLKAKSQNPILPAVECVHAKTTKDGIILTCTDLETTIVTGITAQAEPGIEFLIPPQAYAVINLLKDAEIDAEISVDNKQLILKYGENVMKFEPESIANYPTPATQKKGVQFSLEDTSEFFRILDDCLKFTSGDDLRPAMTGVYFTEKELAATDAHRLLRVKYKAPVDKKKFNVILPKSFIRALPILSGAAEIEISAEHITIHDSATKIISRTIDGSFPKYEAVIPKANEYHFSINAAEVKRNIRVASTLTTKDRRVIFNFKKTTYTLKGYDSDLGQEITLHGKCQLAYTDAFKGLEIAFNGALLTQLLDVAANADIVLEVSSGKTALVVTEDKYTLLLMPLMVEAAEQKQAEEQVATTAAAATTEPTEAAKEVKKAFFKENGKASRAKAAA